MDEVYQIQQVKKNKIFNKDLSDVDYLIYAHSFIDGQLFYGYDEFVNLFDWLEFTIKFLKKRNKKIIVKSHPNFHNKIFGKKLHFAKVKISNAFWVVISAISGNEQL